MPSKTKTKRKKFEKSNKLSNMKKVFNISSNFEEAEDWDIYQYTNMTENERLKIAKELEIIFYGKDVPDVRESKKFRCYKIPSLKT